MTASAPPRRAVRAWRSGTRDGGTRTEAGGGAVSTSVPAKARKRASRSGTRSLGSGKSTTPSHPLLRRPAHATHAGRRRFRRGGERPGPMTMTDPVAVRLPERAVLRLDGPDAAELLQGLVSNDVRLLTPERALYAALLTPQGKYLHDFVLYRQGDAILLDTERERADELRRRLLMYRLRAKVGIELPDPQPAVLAVLGEEAAGRLGLVEEPGAARAEGDAGLGVGPRPAAPRGRGGGPGGGGGG